jgi:hypothetical protein
VADKSSPSREFGGKAINGYLKNGATMLERFDKVWDCMGRSLPASRFADVRLIFEQACDDLGVSRLPVPSWGLDPIGDEDKASSRNGDPSPTNDACISVVICLFLGIVRDNVDIPEPCLEEARQLAVSAGCMWLLEHKLRCVPVLFEPAYLSIGASCIGRSRDLAKLAKLMTDRRRHRPVLLAGTLGSGRTSLLRGGLRSWLSLVGFGCAAGSGAWVYTVLSGRDCGASRESILRALLQAESVRIEPGRVPVTLPAGAASFVTPESNLRIRRNSESDERWLFAIDDLDVLLTGLNDETAEEVLDCLLAGGPGSPSKVVATVETRSLPECSRFEALKGAINEGSVLVMGQPDDCALRAIIRELAKFVTHRRQFTLSREAVDVIWNRVRVTDAPLVYSSLLLCDLQYHLNLTDPGECEMDSLVRGLPEPFKARMRKLERAVGKPVEPVLSRIFCRMVGTDGSLAPRRFSCPISCWAGDPEAQAAIRALSAADTGLFKVVPGREPVVTLATEGLILAWPELTNWMRLREDAVHFSETLRYCAKGWAESGFPITLRWRDELLCQARRLLQETGLLQQLEQDQLLADFLSPEAEYLLAEIDCSTTDARRREAIGVRLAELNDQREGIGLLKGLPAVSWAEIPAGKVVIDGQEEIEVSSFLMARFPITRKQFQAFLHAEDGYVNLQWWDGLLKGEIDALWTDTPVNYPVTRVSWYDAVAFCRWLSAKCGFEVRLPDEWEWQWAAQSARYDFVYPWGGDWCDRCANTDESGVGRATAVGLYPSGQSLQRVHDLSGNTWEWCRNSFLDHRRSTRIPEGARVIKGGSWRVNRGFARADFRLDALSEDRFSGISFRVVCS